jgi:sialic acid synthase SpsE
LLEDLGAPAYKIASFEVVDLPLIRYAASTKKPIIISTGMANFNEITEAVVAAKDAGCQELALLHCVSGYPAPVGDYNLLTIVDMMNKFGLVTGISDHTLNNLTAIASVAMGASIIEKHFTLDRSAGGPDDSFSIEPSELFDLCRDARLVWSAVGNVNYSLKSSEQDNVKFRRSLYFIQNLNAGTVITDQMIRSVRPGYGLQPKYRDKIIGKKLLKDVSVNTPVNLDVISLDASRD